MNKYRRIVVKIGSSTLTHDTGRINIRRVEKLVKVMADIRNSGSELLVVSSGAIATGVGKLGLRERPKDVTTKQACAAVGQCELMYIYDKLFAEYNHTVSQVLLTSEDIAHEERSRYVENTLERLLELGSVPIINENDTVAVNEIVIGDNDTLSAVVAKLVKADLLILLSDIDGMYDGDPRKDPNAKLLSIVTDLDKAKKAAGGAGSSLGTGGMATKIEAAYILKGTGTDMMIVNGNDPERLYAAAAGEKAGTYFPAG